MSPRNYQSSNAVQAKCTLLSRLYYAYIYSDLNDDCADVVDALESLKTRWKELGFKLRLRPDKLQEIEQNYSRNSSHCLHEVVVEWLRQNYNTERFGEPTWRSLAEAVWKLNKQVFRTIAREHNIQNTGIKIKS